MESTLCHGSVFLAAIQANQSKHPRFQLRAHWNDKKLAAIQANQSKHPRFQLRARWNDRIFKHTGMTKCLSELTFHKGASSGPLLALI